MITNSMTDLTDLLDLFDDSSGVVVRPRILRESDYKLGKTSSEVTSGKTSSEVTSGKTSSEVTSGKTLNEFSLSDALHDLNDADFSSDDLDTDDTSSNDSDPNDSDPNDSDPNNISLSNINFNSNDINFNLSDFDLNYVFVQHISDCDDSMSDDSDDSGCEPPEYDPTTVYQHMQIMCHTRETDEPEHMMCKNMIIRMHRNITKNNLLCNDGNQITTKIADGNLTTDETDDKVHYNVQELIECVVEPYIKSTTGCRSMFYVDLTELAELYDLINLTGIDPMNAGDYHYQETEMFNRLTAVFKTTTHRYISRLLPTNVYYDCGEFRSLSFSRMVAVYKQCSHIIMHKLWQIKKKYGHIIV
jgi:hypothetical protein